MKKGSRKIAAVLLAVAVAVVCQPRMQIPLEVHAAGQTVTTETELRNALAAVSDTGATEIQLDADITAVSGSLTHSAGNMILDLNGHKISGAVSGYLLDSAGSSLTIVDSQGTGQMENTTSGGGVIRKTGGSLSISGGTYAGVLESVALTGCEAKFTGGKFSTSDKDNGYTLHLYDNNRVSISGSDTMFSSYYGVVVVGEDPGNTLSIEDGTFEVLADSTNTFGYSCYINAATNLSISGGTFKNEYGNSSLFISSNVSDSQVDISGGIFEAGIARVVIEDSKKNVNAFYGAENETGGIISPGYVMTDNAVTPKSSIIFTAKPIRVVPGTLIRFHTLRSTLETYTESETEEANEADMHSLLPVSVGADGTIYENAIANDTPAADVSRVTDTNSYTFTGWRDAAGKEVSDVAEYVSAMGSQLADTTLYGVWRADVRTETGLRSAVNNAQAVKELDLTDDITLSAPVDGTLSESLMERTMDLKNRTIRYSRTDGSDSAAISLKGKWKVQNGSVISQGAACLDVLGNAVLTDLSCSAADSVYALGLTSDSAAWESRILSGTYETTQEGSGVIRIQKSGEAGTAADMTQLFTGVYPSSAGMRTEGKYTYLDAKKLYVLQSPVTYLSGGETIDLGSIVYGAAVPAIERSISNQNNTGDITIQGISVDNPVFVAEGDTVPVTLNAGSDTLYRYSIKTVENPAPGTYEGTVSITGTRMDGEPFIYQHKVSLTVEKKQLTVTEPVLVKSRTYDGTTQAAVTAGSLNGIVGEDEVTLTAAASYNSADAGTGKQITLTYSLTGKDAGKYLAPAGQIYSDGVILPANGQADVSITDYYVGQTASPHVESSTNPVAEVTWYYKQKDASDDTYSRQAPTEAGSYTLKAVLPAAGNYTGVEKTLDFTISYLEIPGQPYTLSGTMGSNGWYCSPVRILPPEGYEISTSEREGYASFLQVDATAEPVIYLKDQSGAITSGIRTGKIWIDATAPLVQGVQNGASYYRDEIEVTISDENLKRVTLNGLTWSFQGNAAQMVLTPAVSAYVITAEDDAGNTVKYTFTVNETWYRTGITANGRKHLMPGKPYRLGNGQWTVSGDATVYSGGISFYVPKDGDYAFQQQ